MIEIDDSTTIKRSYLKDRLTDTNDFPASPITMKLSILDK